MFIGQLLRDLQRVIGTAIVNYDHLIIRVGLSQNTGNRGAQVCGVVVAKHDDGDSGRRCRRYRDMLKTTHEPGWWIGGSGRSPDLHDVCHRLYDSTK